MNKITFKQYLVSNGFKVIRTYKNETGFYANILWRVSKDNKSVTQVLQGGTVVRLSLKDLSNPAIVGDNTEVVWEKSNGESL